MEKTKTHGFSQHSAEDSVLQGVKRKGSAFTFLKRILPTICFHKVPPQEMGVELELKIQAAIESDPAS